MKPGDSLHLSIVTPQLLKHEAKVKSREVGAETTSQGLVNHVVCVDLLAARGRKTTAAAPFRVVAIIATKGSFMSLDKS